MMSMAATRISIIATTLLILSGVSAWSSGIKQGLDKANPIIVDKAKGEIRALAVLQPGAFSGGWLKRRPGHHAVVWQGGKSAGEALLTTFASDSELYTAMIAIGAKPGNNLTQAVWDDRNDDNSKAPETRVEGSPVDALVWWDGLEKPLPLKELLIDPDGKGVDLRFGGQKALIPVWRSGCVICLYSCPGGKISNHLYTIRDYVDGKKAFAVNKALVPDGKREAVVIFRLRKDAGK
ncbi:YdjY domain-containing protein [Thermodesulfobacteriota bacterium]